MRYTQSQVREAVGLSSQTIRHWQKALPPLKDRQGRGAIFTFGDIVALSLIKQIADDLGVQVGQLTKQSVDLFTACNESSWASFSSSIAIVTPTDALMVDKNELTAELPSEPSMILPIAPIIFRLRQLLLTEDRQQQLPLPLSALPSRRVSESDD